MRRNALIVDDQPDIRKLILMTMECEDFDLHEADNGEDAWSIAQKLRPAVVLLDVMMPGSMDGIELCRRLKSEDRHRKTRIVILSAKGQDQDKQAGKQAGADGYLTKPFSPRELLDVVKKHLH